MKPKERERITSSQHFKESKRMKNVPFILIFFSKDHSIPSVKRETAYADHKTCCPAIVPQDGRPVDPTNAVA